MAFTVYFSNGTETEYPLTYEERNEFSIEPNGVLVIISWILPSPDPSGQEPEQVVRTRVQFAPHAWVCVQDELHDWRRPPIGHES
jgi:hypothetical protein